MTNLRKSDKPVFAFQNIPGLFVITRSIHVSFVSRGNSKHFLPPVNGGKNLNLELTFKTKSHM